MSNENRFLYLDNIAGVLVLHMIFVVHIGHWLIPDSKCIHCICVLLGCFMAWFFYKSGIFYRKQPFMKSFLSSTKRLLVPWIVFTFVPIAFGMTHRLMTGDSLLPYLHEKLVYVVDNCATHTNQPLWFLLSLYCVKVVYALLRACLNVKPPVIAAIALILAYYMNLKGSEYMPYYIGTFGQGLFFYTLGDILKDWQYRKPFIFAVLGIYLISLIWPVFSDFRHNSYSSVYLLGILYCCAGIVLLNYVSFRLFDKKIPLLTYIGRNSMTYYIVHWPILVIAIYLINTIPVFQSLHSIGKFWICCAFMAGALFMAEGIFKIRFLKWVLGDFSKKV